MDVFKMMPMIASIMSNEELAQRSIYCAKKYLEDPSEDNFSSLEFTATLIATKRAVKLAGGVEEFNNGLEEVKNEKVMVDITNLNPSDN